LFLALLDAALGEKEGVWNEDGIYFPENGRMVSYNYYNIPIPPIVNKFRLTVSCSKSFGDLSAAISKEAHAQG